MTKKRVDLVLQPDWIVPVCPRDQVLLDHVVVVEDGVIEAVCSSVQAQQQYDAEDWRVLPKMAVAPGLVNAHTHAAMSLMRGCADDLPLMTWLQEHIWPAEQKLVSLEFVTAGTELACVEMLRGGTTCFSDMYFFPDATAAVAQQLGLRAVVGLIVIDFPSAWARDADDYLRKGLALHNQMLDQPLITTALAPHAPYTVSDAPLERIRMIADEADIKVHMHVHETAGEIEQAKKASGERPLARLKRLGLLNDRLIAVHMTQLSDEEIELVAGHGVSIAHCPQSNLKLASGMCPVQRLLDSGANVAIGTDGAASNNDLDMLAEMQTAALLAKGVSGDASAVPAAVALEMATINGAKALGLDHLIGSVERGKAADLIAIDMSAIESQPMFNVVSQLVYACQRHQVRHAWVAGRQLVDNGVVAGVDMQRLKQQTRQWGSRVQACQ